MFCAENITFYFVLGTDGSYGKAVDSGLKVLDSNQHWGEKKGKIFYLAFGLTEFDLIFPYSCVLTG